MENNFTYFMIPLDQLPMDASCQVWFGTWSTANPTVNWSQDQPAQPDGVSTWAVCIAGASEASLAGASLSAGATNLGDGGKDLPPPPLELSDPASSTAFRNAFSQWLNARSA